MIEEVSQLAGRVERLLELVRQLGDENVRLKHELESARAGEGVLRERIEQARSRVETALARLPAATELQN